MPRIDIFNIKKKKVADLELDDSVFGAPVREHLYYEIVKMQQANRRAGTACTKDRGEVAYSTRKLFRQKGTGRARRGSRRSPVLRGGGVAFGPKPRDYSYRAPRSMRKAALRSALSGRVGEGRMIVIDDFTLSEIKTKNVAQIMAKFDLKDGLIVDGTDNSSLRLSVRNLPNFKFLAPEGVNVYDVLRFTNLVLTQSAVQSLEGALKK